MPLTTVADFIRLPKKDFLSNLDSGMRYPSYVTWAGFYVPGFPEDGSTVKKELRSQIQDFTDTRISNENDVQKLLYLSLAEAAADNTKKLAGTVNLSLLSACDTPETFVSVVKNAETKYQDKLELTKILAINSASLKDDSAALPGSSLAMAKSILGSGVFSGIYLYGDYILSRPETTSDFTKNAKAHGLKVLINAGSVKTSEDCQFLIRKLEPDSLVQCDLTSKDSAVLSLMKSENVSVIMTPDSYTPSMELNTKIKACFLRDFLEAGIKASLGTESVLLFNKSISQFASDLCNTELFTKDEMISIL